MNRSMTTMPHTTSMISRRRILQTAGIGALPLGLPGMVAAGVDAKRGLGGGAAEKSCIFILLCGGPSHLDTWDLKPAAPRPVTWQPKAQSCSLRQNVPESSQTSSTLPLHCSSPALQTIS